MNQTNNPLVLDQKVGDVTGDGILDLVLLTGHKTKDSPYLQNIELIVQDGASGAIHKIPLSENSGYQPTLFLGRFSNEQRDDILISIDSGGSGGYGYYYVYQFKHNIPKLLFDFNEFNNRYQYEINYLDHYKVEIKNETLNLSFLIDISGRNKDDLNQVYHSNGKLIHPQQGFIAGLSGLYPVDIERNGIYTLQGFNRVSGLYAADGLGDIVTFLKLENDHFIPNGNLQFFSIAPNAQ